MKIPILNEIDTDYFVRTEVQFVGQDKYTIMFLDSLEIDLRLARPKLNGKSILCVAAAYTKLNEYTVDGCFVGQGIVLNKDELNPTLKGVLIKNDSGMAILKSSDIDIKRSLLNATLLFQQSGLIFSNDVQIYNDVAEFQRRALVRFKNDVWAVIENEERKTLDAFSLDLKRLGVVDAINLDMGAWDEGWVVTRSELLSLGKFKTRTNRQSNWLVFSVKNDDAK